MENKRFAKNDSGFICKNCGKEVLPLGYTSRNHCPFCLCSLHVDINPGDRSNTCLGTLIPVEVTTSNKKGYIIKYQCNKCKQFHNNKSAEDDSFKTILKVMSQAYNIKDFEIKNI